MAQTDSDETARLIARAAALELDTPYNPPPGEALHHHTAGFAKILCSAVFITGLDADDAAANVGGFISPFDLRSRVVDRAIDEERQMVTLRLADGVTRTARRYGNQGCVAHPIGEESVHFVPSEVERRLPPAETTPWPMGDVLPDEPWPEEVDMAKVGAALDAGFGASGGADTGSGRDLQGTHPRREVRPGRRHPYAAGELVDDQEPDRHPDGGVDRAGGL